MAFSTLVLKLVYTAAAISAAAFWVRLATRWVLKAAHQPGRWILYIALGWITMAIVAGSLYIIAQTWEFGG